ncbi:hypothetical protein EVAR_57185_1 [Eumeta japonica]|uniref:MADF domain-containing protein n=1 Tax=Eumeta variegata TaxID=151549 RepID=A0A4C1Z1X9_EUMVA|nr:hypothetical protein EVAR_57185_1 [Eumeta japonica]
MRSKKSRGIRFIGVSRRFCDSAHMTKMSEGPWEVVGLSVSMFLEFGDHYLASKAIENKQKSLEYSMDEISTFMVSKFVRDPLGRSSIRSSVSFYIYGKRLNVSEFGDHYLASKAIENKQKSLEYSMDEISTFMVSKFVRDPLGRSSIRSSVSFYIYGKRLNVSEFGDHYLASKAIENKQKSLEYSMDEISTFMQLTISKCVEALSSRPNSHRGDLITLTAEDGAGTGRRGCGRYRAYRVHCDTCTYPPENFLKKKWKTARDYYMRERKKENEERSGSAAKKKKACPYFNLLQFLKLTKSQGTRVEI